MSDDPIRQSSWSLPENDPAAMAYVDQQRAGALDALRSADSFVVVTLHSIPGTGKAKFMCHQAVRSTHLVAMLRILGRYIEVATEQHEAEQEEDEAA